MFTSSRWRAEADAAWMRVDKENICCTKIEESHVSAALFIEIPKLQYLCKRSFPQFPISYFSDSSKFYMLCWSLQQFTIIFEHVDQAATEADTNMTFGKYLHNHSTSCRQGMTGNSTDLNSFRFNKSLQREVKGFVAAHVVFEPLLHWTKDL